MQEVNRRQFLKGAGLGVAAMAMAPVVGCAKPEPEPAPAPTPTPAPVDAKPSVLSADVRDMKWNFEVAPEAIADASITTTHEADVVVIGAGTAGLCTAISAAQAGQKVILFAMGAGPVGRGGSNFAFHSKYRASLGLEPVKAFPFMHRQMLGCSYDFDQAKWFKWYKHSEESMNWMIDIMEETGEYTTRLEQIQHDGATDVTSIEYAPIATHAWTSELYPKLGVGDGQPAVVARLAQKAEELGVQIFWNTRARQLVRGGVANGTTGRVEAVIAEAADGTIVKFAGKKAIVLATGDFSRDRDMVQAYAPQAYEYITNFDAGEDFNCEEGKVYGGLYEGDGHKMGLWVGAAWQKSFPNAMMCGTRFGGADDIGILLNSEGKRFMCESLAGTFATNAYKNVCKGKMFQIWDSAYAEAGAPWPKRKTGYGDALSTPEEMLATWDKSVEDGKYIKADTVEEVISKLGLPASTIDEIKKYNEAADAGEDAEFGKYAGFLRAISTPPFYGFAEEPKATFLCLMGGLRTDINMRVCDAADEPIPGLYNVGTMIGDSYGNVYSLRLGGQNLGMNCICYGYLTGKFIAENE